MIAKEQALNVSHCKTFILSIDMKKYALLSNVANKRKVNERLMILLYFEFMIILITRL
jgi:hypothetical protein